LDRNQAGEALEIAKQVPIRLLPVSVASALRWAAEEKIYAYDAYFLQLAKERAWPLMTMDRKMAEIGTRYHLEIWEV
jgi:predicted nucleic acid-binding protein